MKTVVGYDIYAQMGKTKESVKKAMEVETEGGRDRERAAGPARRRVSFRSSTL